MFFHLTEAENHDPGTSRLSLAARPDACVARAVAVRLGLWRNEEEHSGVRR